MFTTEQHAVKNFFYSYRLIFRDHLDLFSLVEEYKVDIQCFILKKLSELGPIKLQFLAFADLIKPIEGTKISCHARSNAKDTITELVDRILLTS